MSRLNRKRTKKAGLPSGSLVYTGERKDEKVSIHVIDYDEQNVTEEDLASVAACIPYRNKPTTTWINVDGVHDAAILERFGECFGLHRLVMEDIMNTDQRPKLEDYGEYLYIVLKMLLAGRNGEIQTEQVSIVLGANFVLSFQEGLEGDVFNIIRDRIRSGKGRIRKTGPDYLAYSLIDAIVDNYFVILEKLGDRIELLETELIENPTQKTVHKIYQLKRELIFLHNAVWPLREVVSSLGKQESSLVRETTVPYVRDVYDHVIHVIDSIDIYREMISGMLDMYLSSVSNRLNEVMKVLTVIATIFMPLTFVAGLYGMNFKDMPELDWRYGYPAVLGLMAVIAGIMLFYFKRKKWI
ncbi:MAG: magnesium and cobalt transport protein CorA [Nitrospirae bacterium GWC2_57_9]|nr:MAG: magnesium and cobalt transport protein CorA [Nitrospirae bacterium GWC2_57_9]